MIGFWKRLGALSAIALAAFSTASAQIPFTKLNADPQAANAAFAPQNALGPTGANYQVNYPYPGQCVADPANQALFPTLTTCPAANSFACPAGFAGISNQSAGGWSACGGPLGFKVLSPIVPDVNTQKFVWEVLNPADYTPDTTTFPGADYYELGVHEAWGFQALANLGAFPNPVAVGGIQVPNGMQWTGLTCNVAAGCTCPAGLTPGFQVAYCSGVDPATGLPVIPFGKPLFTPIWGIGQINNGGTLGIAMTPVPSPWSQNRYIATWPSISIRTVRDRPAIVRWVNEFPNSHVLCPHADAADWPCSIDRTFMGVKAKIDPALAGGLLVPPEGVNQFGSPQQPDNSWVTHLHGGEVPPSVDGFAEKWYGSPVTSSLYTPAGGQLVNPPFENPSAIALRRPAGNFDTYTYPMIQEEATIWFHDHTLGKTHHNVIAGPAGFAPTKEPKKHGGVLNGMASGACPTGYAPCTTEYTWLDPVTEIRGGLANLFPAYDLFLAIQDRAFNDDGSLNFSNGLGQTIPPPPAPLPIGYSPVTSGVNPQVHPVWVPEYFGDQVLVNGVLWPKKSAEPGWYRIRLVDGSDSRCYTVGFQSQAPGTPPPAPGAAVTFNTSFYVLANDQGYLKNPVLDPNKRITMCPGERYELLVDFGGKLTGATATGQADVYMVNNAAAPFPAGLSPQAGFAPDLNVIMKFQVDPKFGPGIKSCGQTVKVGKVVSPVAPAALTWDPTNMASNLLKGAWAAAPANYSNICMPANPALQTDPAFVDIRPAIPFPAGTIVRQVYLNEKVDGVTLAPLGMQLNGVPFEYKVTETPKAGSREVWQFVNLTVDAHPMHPHLVKHQIVARQKFNVGQYKNALCGSTTCQPGPAPGGEMQVIPDVNGLAINGTPFLTGLPTLVTAASGEGGWKDTTQAPPGFVTTIVADWTARWAGAGTPGHPAGGANAPGTAGCLPNAAGVYACAGTSGTAFVYETVTSGPYVWHCHINSHEDSEMMHTSLVVP
jgi:FtsP/CotA-like multicopper oxidase with cupredoxin domain